MNAAAHDVFRIPEDFPPLQEAFDAVRAPTTIVIAPGLYEGPFRLSGKEYVVVQSSHLARRGVTLSAPHGEAVLSVRDSVLHLSGIEVRSNQRTRGILAADAKLSLQECVVAGNRATGHACDGAGLWCERSKVHIQKSVIAGNTLDASGSARGGGASFEDCRIEIAGCTIDANAVYAGEHAEGGGLWCVRSRMRMWRSRVTDNALHARVAAGGGIFFDAPDDTQLGGSVITGNGGPDARGGGIFARGVISIHRNSIVRRNHPDDVVTIE